jgi:hypothetical protein
MCEKFRPERLPSKTLGKGPPERNRLAGGDRVFNLPRKVSGSILDAQTFEPRSRNSGLALRNLPENIFQEKLF